MERETLNILIGGAIAIVAALIATLGAEIRAWSAERSRKQKILRTALFRQLELHGEVIRLSPDTHETLYAVMNEMFAEVGLSEELTKSFEGLKPHLAGLMQTILSPDIQLIAGRYENLVESVAEVDPLLTERISPRFDISRLPLISNLIQSPPFAFPASDPEPFRKVGRSMLAFHNKRFLKSVETNLLETAKRLGRRTTEETKVRIRERREAFLTNDSAEMKSIIGPIIISWIKEITSRE